MATRSVRVDDDHEIRRLSEAWKVLGVTFVAFDPDGHRLRVCTPDD
ncbi:hypothetical protein [Burkholderia cepacia]